jgi:LysM repeat protein
MKKIFLGLLVFTLATGGVRAQDAATQQQLDKLSGQLQDLTDTLATQDKELSALKHEVADLRDKVNTPAVNNFANNDDLQKLAAQLQEIDRKRQADRELILAKIEDLAKISAAPVPTHTHHPIVEPKDNADEATPPADNSTHYEHKVEAGETLSAIAKAYQEKGVKVTVAQILKANPGLKANTLYVGKVISIPMPESSGK